MNDRFRFRVWSVRGKEMIYNAEIAYDGTNYPTEWQLGENNNDGWICCFGEYIDRQEDYKVMQCTGLKDKTGRLIYEGDILATSNNDPKYDLWKPEDLGYTVVCWNEKDLCFAGTKWFIDCQEEESVFNAQFVEVVGNIHENHELLEAQK